MGFINPGTGLSSQAVTRQVLSLLTVFTVVFGMGTGVFRSLRHQERFRVFLDHRCLRIAIYGLETHTLETVY